MQNKTAVELAALKNHMAKNNLLPCEEIVTDGVDHIYTIMINSMPAEARYCATLDPFDFEEEYSELHLICTYGLTNGAEYTYSSLVKES